MDIRRPSLIDQMAIAAALEGLADDDDDDDDDDDGMDDIEDVDEYDEFDSVDDDEIGDLDVAGGDGRRENELMLDYDIPAEDDFDDEVTNAVLLRNQIKTTSPSDEDDDDVGLVELAVMDQYIRAFETNEYPLDPLNRTSSSKRPVISRRGINSNSMVSQRGRSSVQRGGRSVYDDNEDVGSVPSRVDSEGRDHFDDDDDHLIHQFARRYGGGIGVGRNRDVGSSPPPVQSNIDLNGEDDDDPVAGATTTTTSAALVPRGAMLVNTDELEDTRGDPNFIMNALDTATNRRPSFTNPRRRTSHQSYTSCTNSDLSYHSEPNVGAAADSESTTHTRYHRPRSIAVPNAENAATGAPSHRRGSSRRSSGQLFGSSANIGGSATGSLVTSGSPVSGGGNSSGSGSAKRNLTQSIGSAASILTFRSRKSRAQRASSSTQVRNGPLGSLDSAIESLRQQDSNSEWENVAAAVTIVQASEHGGASASKAKNTNKFAVNDTVLVFLTLLNVTNMEDPKDTFTIAPVNKYGYPAGSPDARTDAEKSGPYTFVLCFVKHVHFDEDDRYYTVERADTGTEQRADTGWMEIIDDPHGIEVAARAARKTLRSTQDKPEELVEATGVLQDFLDLMMDILAWPREFLDKTLIPLYRRLRRGAKIIMTQLLWGESPFSCRVRLTGINILVLCSIAFLFLEVINLAFLSADLDDEMAIIGAIIWTILVLELIFEAVIRPSNYSALIESDKAFAPSTARYINRFHLFFEMLALLTYVPEFSCVATSVCTRNEYFSRVSASWKAVLGPTHGDSALGRLLMGLTSLRFFGVIRHWKQMWISSTFKAGRRYGIEKWLFPRHNASIVHENQLSERRRIARAKKYDDQTYDEEATLDVELAKTKSTEDDQRLKSAATIGTALMVVNSQRALLLMVATLTVIPMLSAMSQQNLIAPRFTQLLEANNVASVGRMTDCDYLEMAIESWLSMAIVPQPPAGIPNVEQTFVLWAQVLPVRCPFQHETGVITSCTGRLSKFREQYPATCEIWESKAPPSPDLASEEYFAATLNLRPGGIVKEFGAPLAEYDALAGFSTTVYYNQNPTISLANMGLFYLLLTSLFLGLFFLQALRGDAIRLVLDPLQSMLKIVLRYAENPLSPDLDSSDGDHWAGIDGEEIGNFETEQLINAISKIADLLRKCWGVAGAGIISSNLARTEEGKTVVFNPTVPGKRVYALFGFVGINGFNELLKSLERDVMILINDVALVVHDEVYRWALGEHGQCNKNLGPAFLMVWRIGDFSEVHKKKQVATAKLFQDKDTKKSRTTGRGKHRPYNRGTNSARKSRGQGDEIQLESLPGIQSFTDRALLGMLKSFASLHRDKKLSVWKDDFRLTAGVTAYHTDIMYGMDAGWAVEGAVGSEYKIDATYLSPHVNMASRMMSATKQYDVTILVSKAVEKLLSKNCRKKLRHIDTVYVKGSKVKQDIFTYDARFEGVDFFLLERTPEAADQEAAAYNPSIWDKDQDLRAMRQHVSDAFIDLYHSGIKHYLDGKWPEAYNFFQRADSEMIRRVIEDGYLEIDADDLDDRIFNLKDQSEDIVRIRHQLGDGACRALMNYMDRRNRTAPPDWDAVRQLYSK